jgi:hypothetical protein
MSENADGKWCVLEDGRQVTGPLDEATAKAQADERRRKLSGSRPTTEGQGAAESASNVKATQILHG